MEKNMFFVIPEMPSKTFVMVLKKLPDHFKIYELSNYRNCRIVVNEGRLHELKMTLCYISKKFNTMSICYIHK